MWFRDVNFLCVGNVPQQSMCGTESCSLVAAHHREKRQKKNDLTMATARRPTMVRVFYEKKVRAYFVGATMCYSEV